MNNKEFIQELSQRTGYSLESTRKLLQCSIDNMVEVLEQGESFFLNRLGTFEVKKRNERVMVSPTTGKRMLVPPKLVVGFRPQASLKDNIKNQIDNADEKDS